MRRRLACLLACLIVSGAAAGAAHEARWVEFPALQPFQDRPVTLRALEHRPPGPGPFPALVLMHGCSGMYTGKGEVTQSYQNWAALLAERGYVALLVDSFGPRGERSICEQQQRAIRESRERMEDAYAAARWLAGEAHVARGRIGLIGWSNGASGTLYAMRAPARHEPVFRAAVAYYPGCVTLARAKDAYRPYAPLLILIGEADDWTPAAACVTLTERARALDAPLSIVTYPGAYHAFDRNSPLRYRPTVRNLRNPDRLGATVGEDPAAREDSIRRTLEFFGKQLAG